MWTSDGQRDQLLELAKKWMRDAESIRDARPYDAVIGKLSVLVGVGHAALL